MKPLFLFVFLIYSSVSLAQSSSYLKKMDETLKLWTNAKTIPQTRAIAGAFERIGAAEKTQWLPYYYAALVDLSLPRIDTKYDVDALALVVMPLIDKAEAIELNSELYCLRNMVFSQQLGVNPIWRWKEYGDKATEQLFKAKAADASNPRIYYLKGISVFYTPAAFGGGKEKALVLFKKSIALFQIFKRASSISPDWGKDSAEEYILACK